MSSWSRHLLELGFSANDVAIYQALLKHGPCMAGPLITETGFHRNIVYTSLAHLVARKLVAEQQVRGRAQFSVTDPRQLADEYAEKATLAASLVSDIRADLARPSQEITLHQGNQEYLALLTSLIKQLPIGGEKYVLGTGGEAFMRVTMMPIWKKYHAVAHAQKLRIHMIGYEPQREAIDPAIAPTGLYEMRYLSSALENPSGIHIYPAIDTVLNIIYSTDHEPVTAIKIRNASLTKGYLNLFQNLWKMGEK
jgi:predicted transcriptional regulator